MVLFILLVVKASKEKDLQTAWCTLSDALSFSLTPSIHTENTIIPDQYTVFINKIAENLLKLIGKNI